MWWHELWASVGGMGAGRGGRDGGVVCVWWDERIVVGRGAVQGVGCVCWRLRGELHGELHGQLHGGAGGGGRW